MKKLLISSGIVLGLTLFTTLNGFSQSPVKRVLIEEYTGTWCSSCAFGNIYFDYTKTNYPNAIPVAIHTGDVMENNVIKSYMQNYFTALPRFMYDRIDFPENPQTLSNISAYPWPTALDTLDYYLDQVYNDIPLATVGIDQDYDTTTREITVTISANFIQNASGNFRLNCYIVEDSVHGGAEYDQNNSNFSGWTSGPSFLTDLINSPSTIPNFYHGHVVREMLGSPEGATAQIPTSVDSNDVYSKTFTYILPIDYDEDQIEIIGVVQNYGSNMQTDREIINANAQHLGEVVIVDNDTVVEAISNKLNSANIKVYPNPINSNSVLEFYNEKSGNVFSSIIDLQGKTIVNLFNDYLYQGEYRVALGDYNLKQGVYILQFVQDNNIRNHKIVIE